LKKLMHVIIGRLLHLSDIVHVKAKY
jgi:hypothetical protein